LNKPIKKGKYFYHRVSYNIIEDGKKRRREVYVSLNTTSEEVAKQLLPRVKEREKLFKDGIISKDQLKSNFISNNENLVEQFIALKKLEECNPKTINIYYHSLRLFCENFPNKDVTFLVPDDREILLQAIKEKWENIHSRNKCIRNCKTFLKWCFETHKINRLPFILKQFPANKRYPRYFTQKELNEIFKYIEKVGDMELFHRVKLHLHTGMRLNELSNSNLKGKYLYLFNTKTKSDREIPMDDEALESYRYLMENGKYHKDTVSKKFKQVLVDLNFRDTMNKVKRTFHCLRHTFAVKKFADQERLFTIKHLLGHSSVQVTESVYTVFDQSKLEQDFPKLEEKNETLNNNYIENVIDFNVPDFLQYNVV